MAPAPTGVADYSAELVRALRAEGAQVAINPTTPCDRELYHIGNNPLHAEIYKRALARPGAVVLHDALLHHFFLGRGGQEDYVAEFVYNYGTWHESLARQLWRGRARSGSDPLYFQYGMLKRLVETALTVIVHNPAAKAAVEVHGHGKCIEIPHLYGPVPDIGAPEVVEVRRSWGVPPGGIVLGVFGHLRESKRIHTVLNAFERLATKYPVRLLLAGDCVSSDLVRALDARRRHPGIIRVGYLAEPGFWLHAAATDICLNLRFPPAGETSGIAIRFMGLGKPVVVTDGLEVSRYPDDALVKIDSGLAEEEMLICSLAALIEQPFLAERIGKAAQYWIRTEHDPRRIARQYLSALLTIIKG